MQIKQIFVLFFAALVVLGFTPFALAPPADNPSDDRGPLTKIVFIHYKKGFGHKPQHNTGGNGGGPSCYTLLAKDAKWKTTANGYVNPTNSYGLTEAFLVTNVYTSRETWDANTSFELFNDVINVDYAANWDADAPDGRNEYSFGNYPQAGVIAVTVVWGYFFGPPFTREIVEYDVLFDTDFVWGDATLDSTLMDFLNIGVHETGHGAGLGDVYETACSEVTMYGYSAYGETKKRTLELQDVNGLHKLYLA